MPPVIYADKCTGCGICYKECPLDVFRWEGPGKAPTVAYPDECWHCGACMVDCPIPGAIDIRLPLPLMILHVESPTARPVVEYPEAVQVRGGGGI